MACHSTVDHGAGESITAVHHDIVQTHILTRLDGPTLIAAGCASSQLHELSCDEKIWRDVCTGTWPSVELPCVSEVICEFPGGHRSFFSHAFPVLDYKQSKGNLKSPTNTTELISAVDIYYHDNVIYSSAQETEKPTESSLFLPFRLDLLDPKVSVPTRIRHEAQNDAWIQDLEENLKLSWILIDPAWKRAVNVSSRTPVCVKENWITDDDVQLRYTTIMMGDKGPGSSSAEEFFECAVMVTCARNEAGEVHVSEVSMQVEDMDGRMLSGKESLVILKGAMDGSKRTKGGKREETKERYKEFVEKKRERKQRVQRRERALDMACRVLDIACVAVGVAVFVIIWS